MFLDMFIEIRGEQRIKNPSTEIAYMLHLKGNK